MQNVVGRYSERSGYHVFHASALVAAVEANHTSLEIKDIHDQIVAKDGVFNKDAVANVIPALTIKRDKISAAGIVALGQFAEARSFTSGADEQNLSVRQPCL